VAANVALNWFFVVRLGMDHRGLALATSMTMTVSLVCLWVLLRRRSEVGRLDGGRTLVTLVKTLAVSILMGAFAFATFRILDGSLGHEIVWTRLLQVGSAIVVACAVFVAGCKLLHVSELDQAFAALRPRR
jgi:peptidoglycan biosynthesis protein MviN/MurJ (putative lipid II flippase)